jgi:transposase InsO family protein
MGLLSASRPPRPGPSGPGRGDTIASSEARPHTDNRTDPALAESFVDSFKTELIADRVWRTRAQLELAMVEYIGWFNHDRLHESLGDLPPAEFEAHGLPAQAAPKPGEGHTFNGRPLSAPVASEILIS